MQAPLLSLEPVQHPGSRPSETGLEFSPDRAQDRASRTTGGVLRRIRRHPEDWSHPVYFATASDPRYRIDQTGWVNRDIEGQRIHVPPRAKPAGGPDHTFTVVQPNGWEYNFYRARAPTRSTRTLSARFGKREWWAGDGLGTSRPPYRGGITAAGSRTRLGSSASREMKGRCDQPRSVHGGQRLARAGVARSEAAGYNRPGGERQRSGARAALLAPHVWSPHQGPCGPTLAEGHPATRWPSTECTSATMAARRGRCSSSQATTTPASAIPTPG